MKNCPEIDIGIISSQLMSEAKNKTYNTRIYGSKNERQFHSSR